MHCLLSGNAVYFTYGTSENILFKRVGTVQVVPGGMHRNEVVLCGCTG